jgi:short-subunit dehydrogenase
MKNFYQDKTIVLTGASSGIGACLAKELGKQGATVILLARRLNALQDLQKEIQNAGGKAFAYPLDVSHKEDVQACASLLLKQHAPLHILINNAGIMSLAPFEQLPLERHEEIVQTNLLGSLYLTHALLPHFLEQKKGHIVFVASLVGHVNMKNFNTYSATKFALVGLSEGLRAEMHGKGITVQTLCPPATQTPLLGSPEVAEKFKAIPVEKVVHCLLRGMRGSQKDIFCSFDSKALVWIKRFCPALAATILRYYE